MSEIVEYKGKVRVVDLGELTLEQMCEKIARELGMDELPGYYDTWTETLIDEFYDKYVIVDGILFKIEEKEYVDIDDGLFNIHDNGDGTYDYDVRYYDGGFGFSEAIEMCFSK